MRRKIRKGKAGLERRKKEAAVRWTRMAGMSL